MRSPILAVVARGVVPVTTLFALYLLLRGHNAPGGGFVAGLVASAAIALQAVAFGVRMTRRRLAIRLRHSLWIGLTLMILNAFAGPGLGDQVLKQYHGTVTKGSGGSAAFSTTLVFDVGVFLTVVGATSLMLSLVARRQ